MTLLDSEIALLSSWLIYCIIQKITHSRERFKLKFTARLTEGIFSSHLNLSLVSQWTCPSVNDVLFFFPTPSPFFIAYFLFIEKVSLLSVFTYSLCVSPARTVSFLRIPQLACFSVIIWDVVQKHWTFSWLLQNQVPA